MFDNRHSLEGLLEPDEIILKLAHGLAPNPPFWHFPKFFIKKIQISVKIPRLEYFFQLGQQRAVQHRNLVHNLGVIPENVARQVNPIRNNHTTEINIILNIFFQQSFDKPQILLEVVMPEVNPVPLEKLKTLLLILHRFPIQPIHFLSRNIRVIRQLHSFRQLLTYFSAKKKILLKSVPKIANKIVE
jgi:hypothetical protein